MAKRNGKIKRKIEQIFREEGRPMTTHEIMGKLVDAKWKNLPSSYAVSNILREKRFQKVGYTEQSYFDQERTSLYTVTLWYLKEELL